MTSEETLHYTLAIGFFAISISVVYLTYHLVQTLKTLKSVLEDAESVTHDFKFLKEGAKIGLLKLFGKRG